MSGLDTVHYQHWRARKEEESESGGRLSFASFDEGGATVR